MEAGSGLEIKFPAEAVDRLLVPGNSPTGRVLLLERARGLSGLQNKAGQTCRVMCASETGVRSCPHLLAGGSAEEILGCLCLASLHPLRSLLLSVHLDEETRQLP